MPEDVSSLDTSPCITVEVFIPSERASFAALSLSDFILLIRIATAAAMIRMIIISFLCLPKNLNIFESLSLLSFSLFLCIIYDPAYSAATAPAVLSVEPPADPPAACEPDWVSLDEDEPALYTVAFSENMVPAVLPSLFLSHLMTAMA